MKHVAWIAVTSVVSLSVLWGCSGSDTASTLEQPGASGGAGAGGSSGAAGSQGGAAGNAGGAAGSSTGGAAGSSTGGTAGSSTGGAAGSSTGGAAGSSTGGAAGTGGAAANWWPNDYNPSGTAAVPSGQHNAGKNCLNCHTGQGEAPQWLFAGTIYNASGTTPVAHAEVAVKDPSGFYSAFSGTNGNFWVPFAGTPVDWAKAEVRARDSNGDLTMPGTAAAGCNSCHSSSMPLKAP